MLSNEVQRLSDDTDYRNRILLDYKALKEKLGGTGASDRAAKLMYDYIYED